MPALMDEKPLQIGKYIPLCLFDILIDSSIDQLLLERCMEAFLHGILIAGMADGSKGLDCSVPSQ